MIDPKIIKKDFPILASGLHYLDNASTTQKPHQVIEALTKYYESQNANVHRGIYDLSEQATALYEQTRAHVTKFINAKSSKEIIFTRNCTEAINLVAQSWGEENIQEGDEIIVSALEHHSNLLPWQALAKRKNAIVTVIPLKPDYTLEQPHFSQNTKLIAITGMSNVLGTIPNLKAIIDEAKKHGTKVLIDAAQSAAHLPTDVQALDCDFLAFSAHKMLGPTGVGVLYGKESLLESMAPVLFGGDMVKTITPDHTEWNDLPWKFEAGTPNIADVIAFDHALSYLESLGLDQIHTHELKLLEQAKSIFSKYPEVTLYSPPQSGGILSFTLKGVHPHDIAQVFNESQVCIRAGHHCNQPLMHTLRIPATARMSFYLYNDEQDIAQAEQALKQTIKIFS